MKKILITLIPLIALIAGYYFFQTSPTILSPAEQGVSQGTSTPQLKNDNFLATVGADALAVVSISKEKLQPLVNRVLAYSKAVKESAVWSKMQLEKTVEQSVSSQLPSDVTSTVKNTDEGLEKLSRLWTALKDVTVVVSPEQFEFDTDLAMPKAMARVDFQDSKLAEPFLEEAKASLMDPSKSLKDLEIARDPNDPNLFRIYGKMGTSGGEEKVREFGAARIGDSFLEYYLGTDSNQAFTSADEQSTLLSSEGWEQFAPLLGENAAVLFYGRLSALFHSFITALEKTAKDQSEAKEMAQFIAAVKGAYPKSSEMISAGSLDVSDRVVQRVCFSSDGERASAFSEDMFTKEKQLQRTSPSFKLLTGNTVLAISFSSSGISSLLDPKSAQPSFLKVMTEVESADPETQNMLKALAILQKIERAGLRIGSFFINKGIIPIAPDMFLVLETEPGKAKGVVASIKAAIEEMEPQDYLTFTENNMPDGSKGFQLTMKGTNSPTSFIGGVVNNQLVLLASNELAFGSGSQQLLADPMFLSSEQGQALGKVIDGKNYLFLMSTRPVVQLASMFQGFIQAELDKKGISNEEVSAFTELFAFDYLNTQRIFSGEHGISCSDSRTLMMR